MDSDKLFNSGQQTVAIKVYTRADQKAAVELWREVIEGFADLVDERIDIQQRMTNPSQLFLVASVGSHAVGSALADISDDCGHLDYVAVHQEFRRKGIGADLVRQAEKKLTEMGCDNMFIDIDSADEAMMSFFSSLGYRMQGLIRLGRKLEADENGS